MRYTTAVLVTAMLIASAPCLAASQVAVEKVPAAALPTMRPLWKWEKPTAWETAVLGAGVASIWVDVFVTRGILRRTGVDRRHETNFILGRDPSDAKLFLLGGVVPTMVLTAIWYALPYGWRAAPPGIVAYLEIANIATMPGGPL